VLGTYTNASETVVRCQPIGRGTLGHKSADGAEPVPLGYAVGEVDGHPSFLFVGGRLSRRVAAASG